MIGQKMLETPQRIEPALVEDGVPSVLLDLATELATATATLEKALHPHTAAGLASMVRIMNTYYSNLIEGHNTRPKDIEFALQSASGASEVPSTRQISEISASAGERPGKFRDLLIEARAHVQVQAEIDRLHRLDQLPPPASQAFIQWLHCEFYRGASSHMLSISGSAGIVQFVPGQWRLDSSHDVAVGRHLPPASASVPSFMRHFSERFDFSKLGRGARIIAIAAAHHRFNYIHPFPDGNGRVSRLMSHAMGQAAGIGAHGLWSVSRGLARGLESRTDYKRMMDHADSPRQGDLDGRGNLSLKALIAFCEWFLRVCLDQVTFMNGLFEIETLASRLAAYVRQSDKLKPEAARLLEEALVRGSFERGAIARITGLPERTARRVLSATIAEGLLGSETPKGPLSLRFPMSSQEILFPRLFPVT
jgi:Fic family protein